MDSQRRRHRPNRLWRGACLALGACALMALCRSKGRAEAGPPAPPAKPPEGTGRAAAGPLEFIDTSFENASPLWYEAGEDGTIYLHLLYDQERGSPNRAAGHFHFQLQARTGAKLTLEF